MTDFTMKTDADGVATITWDTVGKSMNVMNQQGFVDLNNLVDEALADDAIKGVIITSGKDSSFAGGMDLNIIAKMKEDAGDNPAKGLMDGLMLTHSILRKIERGGMDDKNKGGKPFVAALPGTALGIGLEIPLACHRIIAADNPKAKIGLPEIMVGIFPGMGGTARLTRKLGAMGASPFLLEGKLSNPQKAMQGGLIDEVVPADELLSKAKEWILSEPKFVKPWDEKGYKIPGGAPYHPAGFMTFVGASAMVNGKTQGAFPAAKALLSAVYEGALVPFDTAIKIEARWFTNVLMNPSSSAMIRSLFINKEALEKGANRPDVPDQTVKKVGVMGAGMMGAGIALVSAMAGMEVVLIDQKQEAADKGKAYTADYMDKGIKRKKATEEKKEATLARITATTDYAALKGADLIIEAVFEDPGVKAEVTKEVLKHVGEDCIFATNTSTLPITELAKASDNPENFIGIHFFSPVEKMMLVEIIKGQKTGGRAVAKALDYVRQIRKTPIVVNDARFFYCNRCIIPYINEGIRMVAEGVAPALIDNAARDEQLVERLFAFIIAAAKTCPARPANRINLVNKDDARRIALGLLEHVADPARTDTDKHFNKVRTRNCEEWNASFPCNGARQQCFTGSWRADEQRAFGDLAAKALELRRVFQEVDDLFEFFFGFINTCNIIKCDAALLLRQQPRARICQSS